jgi:tight adherence protein C
VNGSELDLAQIAAIAAAWGAGAFGAWGFFDALREARRARRERLARPHEIIVTETQSGFFRLFLPVARYIGLGLRQSLDRRGDEESPGWYGSLLRRVRARLASAGYPEGLNADEYVGFNLLCALLGGLLGIIVFVGVGVLTPVACFLIGLVLGAMRMPSWLKRKSEERHTAIRRELPFALDLFTLATEAGLDFTKALERIVAKLGRTPLGQEFQVMLREIRLGKTRSEAMRDLGRRVDVTEVQSVMTSLVQAEEMGSQIGPILRIQSEQQRERRSQRAEEAAGKAPVKMLFPLMLIMAVTFLIIFGSMGLRFLLR